MARTMLFLISLSAIFLPSEAFANAFVDAFRQLGAIELGSGPTQWKAVSFAPLFDKQFPPYHPQGIKILGSTLFLSTVQGTSTGNGYLNRYSMDSLVHPRAVRAIGRIAFPPGLDGQLNHAGGFDGDERLLFIPLAAYRPEGPAVIIQVDSKTLEYHPIAWLNDHVGTLEYGKDEQAFHLVDWSTGLYTVPFSTLDFQHRIDLHLSKRDIGSDWEYQDCKNVGEGYAICSAKHGVIWPTGEIHLVHFHSGAAGETELEVVHRIPVPNLQSDGNPGGTRPLTYNAMDFRLVRSPRDPEVVTGMRFYFVPYDDEDARLMVFEAVL